MKVCYKGLCVGTASLLNIAGDLLLVGVFRFGVAGAAAATVFAQIISAAYTLWLLAAVEREGGQKRIWHLHFCREHMTSMVTRGFPLALQSVLFPIANSMVQAGVNGMGMDQIAAWGSALTTYTAQNMGAGKAERVKRGVLAGTAMSAACFGS